MKIPINSILIPERFVTLCKNWNNGVNCTLYIVASFGGLTIETNLLWGYDTAEQAYLSIWRDLAYDVSRMVRIRGDWEIMAEFEVWVDYTVDLLEWSYELTDWKRLF